MQKVSEKIIETVLFSILLILPFSYGGMNPGWNGLFTASAVTGLFLLLTEKIKSANRNILGIVYTILFLLLFDFAEKVNFIYQFSIPVEVTWRIPISTILLVIGMLAFLMKALVEGKVKFIDHPYAWHFLFACAFLVVLMILFYPFLYHYYRMQPGPDIQLLNKVFKYLMIFLLVSDYLSNGKRLRRMSISLTFSMGLTVLLSVLL